MRACRNRILRSEIPTWSDAGDYESVRPATEGVELFMSDAPGADVLSLTAQIVAAHVSKNQIAPEALPSLIQSVYRSLATVGEVQAAPVAQEPAVPIRKSVFPDYIVCLEDGKKLKMLKRHLNASHDMTPDQYRAKWGLPRDYPMVAPNYAITRSDLAKNFGLGRKVTVQPEITVVPARRARGSKG